MATPSALPFPPQTQYINNRAHHDQTSETFLTYNPSTGAPLAQVYTATPSDIDLAIKASLAAFPSWAATPPVERSRILLKAVQLLRERNDEIARVETLDTGKAWVETSTVDVATGADVLEYFAGLGMGMGEGKTVQLRKKAWVYTKKVPLGVCVGIGAWNYPIQIALWKCAPALAAGNTFIFKPSEVTPLTATLLAQILTTAGLPPGVFQLLHGASTVGSALISDPRISKVSFTGQPSTGITVYRTASQNLLPVTLELGGKSPFIVFPDADIDRAVDCCMTANFYSSGQVCTNGTRVFVHETICAEFTRQLKAKVEEAVRIGDPLDPGTNFGPVVSRQHYEKVVSYINHGIREDKATLVIGGPEKPETLPEELKSGFYVNPTIFTDCTDGMKIVREEIFGPVACILSFSSKEEVIRRANDTVLGLAAGVFTRDLDTACEVMDEVNAGICWVNSWGESPAQMPVGGWGLSGLGFENGSEALAQFTKGKSVLVENGAVEPAFSKL
ncbi:putative betaine aldehyde dehydrogenase [Ascodesmis nigricans]|uniref:aldehyde dehydrogenase (NAD(+)) n=1 Tax=Ascodesmis nigricans TaxID=341454 RepID=A0A4S2MX89_9PEZI|nr:putative betaine aldehyde dehydrogenase [Ascodesmis nigricans]